MSKEMIVTLLRKDIAELSQLTDGFEQLEIFPPVLLRLAESKAMAVLENIKALSELPAKVEVPIVEEKQVVFEPIVTILPEKEPEEVTEASDKDDVINPVEPIKEEECVMPETVAHEEKNLNEEVEIATPQHIEVPQADNDLLTEEQPIVEENVVSEVVVPVCEEEVDLTEENTEIIDENPLEPVVVAEETPEPQPELQEELSECIEEEKRVDEEDVKEDVKTPTALSDVSKESFTRNDSITHKKIDDIKQAISLGDRFLFQRELFNNNGELMTKTIGYLNGLTSMDEALQYVNKKFNWDSENPTVERFLQILIRRYL